MCDDMRRSYFDAHILGCEVRFLHYYARGLKPICDRQAVTGDTKCSLEIIVQSLLLEIAIFSQNVGCTPRYLRTILWSPKWVTTLSRFREEERCVSSNCDVRNRRWNLIVYWRYKSHGKMERVALSFFFFGQLIQCNQENMANCHEISIRNIFIFIQYQIYLFNQTFRRVFLHKERIT